MADRMGGMDDTLRGVEDAKREERRAASLVKHLEKAAEEQPVAFARLMVSHARTRVSRASWWTPRARP